MNGWAGALGKPTGAVKSTDTKALEARSGAELGALLCGVGVGVGVDGVWGKGNAGCPARAIPYPHLTTALGIDRENLPLPPSSPLGMLEQFGLNFQTEIH